jgi:superoxide dismutase, Fe-Mn family
MTTATQIKPYEAKSYQLDLDGISQPQLEQHYKLYQGYVNNTNILNQQIAELIEKGEVGTPTYNELKRRFGFEYAGMRLHEFYFDNMTRNGGALDPNSVLHRRIVESFGSYSNWETDFRKTGAMRGIGWAVLYEDPTNGRLINFWISDHENGHPPGFNPVLVMDVWEHAYTVDYKPTERPNYIDAFFRNVNWQAAEARLLQK